MARHVRKGDTVQILTGADAGKVGEVIAVYPAKNKVLVQGWNRAYRHLRPSRQHPQGGRIRKEMPIHISNVLPVDRKTNQPTRVGFKISEDGVKERVARKKGSQESLGTVTGPKKDNK